jgi:hypothetical protein
VRWRGDDESVIRSLMACAIMAMMNWTGRGSIEDGNDAPKWRLVPVGVETADRARIELP